MILYKCDNCGKLFRKLEIDEITMSNVTVMQKGSLCYECQSNVNWNEAKDSIVE